MPTFHLAQPIRATRSVVWQACGTTLGLAAWQADEVRGSVARGERLVFCYPALGAEIDVQVIDVIPESHLVLGMGPRRIKLTLEEGGVSLAHSDLPAGDEYAGTGSAWALSLGTLAHACEHHAGRTRKVRWVIDRARTESSTAHVFFTHASALEAWLGRGPDIGPAGSAYERELGAGLRMSGTVLANTPGRDILLSWQEDGDSLVALRTLPSPFGNEERLVALAWSRWTSADPAPELSARLEAGHRRLVGLLGSRATA